MSSVMSAPPASMAVAPVSSHRLPDTDVPSDFDVMMRMAEQLASADKFLPDELAGKPGNVLALMLRARALNVPFAVACDELYIQRKGGKISQSARLVRALARRAGHRFFTLESDNTHCVLLVQLAGEKTPRRVEFSMQDAHRMGLTNPEGNNKGGQWDKQPANMLYARCTTRAVTRYCPEVILGMGSDFLNEEMPEDQDGSMREPDDVIAAFREEDQRLVEQVLLAAEDTDHLDDGKEREEILLKLGMQYGQVLNYAAGDSDLTVRQVLLARLRAAKERGEKQARGEEVPPAKPFPTPDQAPPTNAPAAGKAAAKGDGAARARQAAGGRTGARARAAADKAARTQGETVVDAEVVENGKPGRDQVFARVLEDGGTWDRRRYAALHAELTDQHISGDRAAMLLKEIHQAHPGRVSHTAGTRYTITVGQPQAPAPKKAAPSGLRPKATQPPAQPPAQEPTPAPTPVADDKILACGCPAEQVLFEGIHLKGCKETGS